MSPIMFVTSGSETVRFKHDCDNCKPLGEYDEMDLYYCDQGPGPTVIARYGDDGPEYTSGLGLADLVPALAEARRRALARDLTIMFVTPRK